MIITDADLAAMSARIVEIVQPERIVLFGSHARGDATPDSDVDLLVITSETYGPHNSRRKILARLWRSLARIHTPVDIILSSVDEVTQWRDTTNHLVAHAMREGKVLYERQ
ncbi:MAG: nucleotidyltransferase domain-containing protein [Magnetococcales bacterium]|nr:nucleotidyltransferase domain-containing protein [Magnetococcales bacterium]